MVLVLSVNSAATGTAPAGWTLRGTQTDDGRITTQVFAKVAAPGDAGSPVTVSVGAVSAVSLQLVAYAGTDGTAPVTSVTGAAGGGGTSHTTPVAQAVSGSMVLSIWSDKGPAARQFTAPAEVTERSNLAGAGNGDVATLVADSGTPVPAGQVGGHTATVSAPSSRSTMLTVVLAPGGGAAPVNLPPEAAITSSCAELTCSFDSSSSDDVDGDIAATAWNFGDGQGSTQPAPEHTFPAAGEYTVTLTVTDDDGATDTATATVTVATAPVGDAIGLRGSAGTAARPVTSASVVVPDAVEAGDGLVLVLSTNSAVTGTVPAGWTLAGTQTDAGRMTTQVFSRVAAAGDAGATVTTSFSEWSAVTLQLLAYSGTSASGPIASLTGAASGAGTSHTTPTATAAAGSWVLSIWSDKSSTARQFVPPASLAERSNLAAAGNGDVATLVADSGAPVAGGTVGGLTATVPTPSSRSTVLTVVLAPAA
jgi:PKD repeat protein